MKRRFSALLFLDNVMLLVMAGLPGCGKSTLAQQLATRLKAVILSKDVLRHALFPPELVEYSTQQDDFVVDLLLRTAEYIWRAQHDRVIILDGRTFSQSSQRQRVSEFAQSCDQKVKFIECVCAEQIAKRRLSSGDPLHPAGNRTPTLFDEVKARWQEIAEPKIVVRTDGDVDVEQTIERLHTS